MKQRTIAEKISCTGIGLHSGEPVHLTLLPARAGSGVMFVRTDLGHPVEIPARPDSVTSTRYATTLGRGDATVGTVEHLLAAVYSLGIDNLRIEVHGPEIPVMDGSSASFVFLLRAAGVYEQPANRVRLRVRRTLEIRDGERRILSELKAVDGLYPLFGGFRMNSAATLSETSRATSSTAAARFCCSGASTWSGKSCDRVPASSQ